jgi:predicted nucleic acid-binding protein
MTETVKQLLQARSKDLLEQAERTKIEILFHKEHLQKAEDRKTELLKQYDEIKADLNDATISEVMKEL